MAVTTNNHSSKSGKTSRTFIVLCSYILLAWLACLCDIRFGCYVLVLYFLCTRSLFKAYINTGTIFLFDFKNYFLLQYFYIHGIGYFCYYARSVLGINMFYLEDGFIKTALLTSIVAVIVFDFFCRPHPKVRKVCRPVTNIINNRLSVFSKRKWFYVLVLAFLLFFMFWMMMGVIPFLTPGFHEEGRTELGKGLGLIESLAGTVLSFTSFYLIYSLLKNKKFDRLSYLIIFTYILIMILNDSRGAVVYYIISIAFLYYYAVGPIKTQYYALGFALILGLAGLLGAMRGSEGANPAIVGLQVATEASVEFDNYTETFEMFENKEHLHGSTLVPIFTIPIPRRFMPYKDNFKTAGVYFKEFHGHDHIRVGERLTYVGELYMNWGYFGVIMGMAFIGMLIKKSKRWFSKQEKTPLIIFLYLSIVNATVATIAGDIATAVTSFFIGNFLVLITAVPKRSKIVL